MLLQLKGAKDLNAVLQEMKTVTAVNTTRRALKAALQPVADAAKANAPRASGRLIESISVSPKLNKRQARQARKAKGKDEVTMHVGSSARHAHLVEYGTGPRYQKKTGKFVGVMPPKPFMRPAWDSNWRGVLESLTEHLAKEIDATIARSNARAGKPK